MRLSIRYHLIMALGLFALGGASNLAAKSTAGEKAAWTANPAVVYQQKGAYPGTLTVRLYSNNCQYDEHGDVKPASALKATDNYAITVTGAGISVLKLDVGDCSLTAALKIELATPGYKQLNVTKNPDGKRDLDAGFAPIDFMDALAGPTPSTPEVDVLWEVLTDHLCKDSFGNHMPHDLYCVEVKIGNNSAHSLQLAGVGFFRPIPNCNNPGKQSPFPCNQDPDDPHAGISTPNVSYATVRASAQAGTTTSLRNILYNGTQAIGLLMASFTPYFTNTVNRARWSTGAAIVGTSLSQAMNLVAPDLTVREMNNLDDQAFRDGKLIPNNTQGVQIAADPLNNTMYFACRGDREVQAAVTWLGKGAVYRTIQDTRMGDPVAVSVADRAYIVSVADFHGQEVLSFRIGALADVGNGKTYGAGPTGTAPYELAGQLFEPGSPFMLNSTNVN